MRAHDDHRLRPIWLALFLAIPAVGADIAYLNVSPNPANLGQAVTMEAPCCTTGRLVFYDGDRIVGAGKFAAGVSKLTTSMLPAGSHTLQARWYAAGSATPLKSAVVALQVNGLPETGNPTSQGTNIPVYSFSRPVLADFNGDGKADVAVIQTDFLHTSLVVLLGNGDGSFQPVRMVDAQSNARDLVVADFDGDGISDIAVSTSPSGGGFWPSVVVYRGVGDGAFRGLNVDIQDATFGHSYYSLVTADFNHDGIPDLALADSDYSSVRVLLGDGTGDFTVGGNYAVGGGIGGLCYPNAYSPVQIAAADFNLDGVTDLAVVDRGSGNDCSYSGASILIGNGNGSFQSAIFQASAADDTPFSITVGDFNRDTLPDLLLVSQKGLGIQLGYGNGRFQAVTYFGPLPSQSSGHPYASTSFSNIGIMDLNADNVPDLVVADSGDFSGNSAAVYTMLGTGNGHYGSAVRYGLSKQNSPALLATGDLNGDGRYDVVLTDAHAKGVQLLLWQPVAPDLTVSLTASDTSGYYLQGQTGITYTATVSNSGSQTMTSGNSDIFVTITAPAGFTITAVSAPHWLATIQDGAASVLCERSFSDLLAAGASYQPIVLTLSAASTALGGGQIAATVKGKFQLAVGGEVNTSNNTASIAAAIRAKSSLSLSSSPNPSTLSQAVTLTATVIPSSATGTVTFYSGSTILGVSAISGGRAFLTTGLLKAGSTQLHAVYPGDNSASPVSTAASPVTQKVNTNSQHGFAQAATYFPGNGAIAIATGDFNRDGRPDLATANSKDNNVSVFLGNSDGTFQNAVNYPVGSSPQSVAIGDFNGDGNADLVAANSGNNSMTVWLGSANGTLVKPVTLPAGFRPTAVAVGDFNDDGRLDIAVANFDENNVGVLLGNGDGTFGKQVTYPLGNSPFALAVADFNRDGVADLGVATAAGVSVMLGNGNGTFRTAIPIALTSTVQGIAVGDLNGDGKPDLALAYSSDGAAVLLGNGDGTFGPAVSYATGQFARGVTVGDFDGDGNTDIAAAIRKTSTIDHTGYVSVLSGKGDGVFQTAANYDLNFRAIALVTADFNGDGRSDLAIANGDGAVLVLLGVRPAADLTVSLSHSGNFTQGSASASYSVTVGNAGSANTIGTVTVTNALTTGISATAISGSGWTCALATLTCTRSDGLATGTSYPAIAVTAKVATDAPDTVTNVAAVSGGGEINTANNTARDLTTIPHPDLTAGSNASGTLFTVGLPAIYNLYAQNTGTASTSGVVTLTDTLPSGVTATAMTGQGWTCVLATLTCTSSNPIAPGASSPAVSLTLRLDTTVPGLITNTVTIAGGGETNTANNSFSQTVTTSNFGLPPDLSVTAANTTSFTPGKAAQFTLSVSNLTVGATSATVVVRHVLPDGIAPTSASGAGWNCSNNSHGVVCGRNDVLILGSYPPIKFDVFVYSDAAGILSSTVTVDGGGESYSAPTYSNNSFSLSTMIQPVLNSPGPSTTQIAFSTSGNPVAFGQPLTLTAVVTPAGTTGSVAFYDGAAILGTVPISAGRAVLTTSLLCTGSHFLKAAFHQQMLAFANQTVTAAPQNGFLPLSAAGSVAGPRAAAAGDFNRDGKMDLAIAGSGGVSILLGKGNGTFYPPVLYPAGANPIDIASADFDGDGISDLAVANNGSNNVTILPGNGDGTFRAGSKFDAGAAPQAIAVFDSGPWGHADLAIANADGVSVLFGFNDGTFDPPVPYTAGVRPLAIVAAALSNSNAPDLVAADSGSNDIAVRINPGLARFSPPIKYPVGTGPRSVAAGDFNKDGSTDLAVINAGSNSLSVLSNQGGGVLQPAVSYALPAQPQFVVAADFNADGFVDLAIAHAGGSVSLLWNRGDGTFQKPIAYAAGAAANFLTIGDFNGDGRADLVVLNTAGNAVSILPGAAPAVARVSLTTSVLPAGSGAITLSPPSADGTYAVGTKVQVTGVPADGYLFTAFGGAITGAANPQTITLTTDATVTANFSPASPAIAMSIANKTTAAGVTTFNLILTNTGAGPAGAVTLGALAVKALAGTGTVALAAPSLPYSAGPIAAGASVSVPVRVTIAGTVTRFSLTVTGTMTNKFGVILSLSGTQAVVP